MQMQLALLKNAVHKPTIVFLGFLILVTFLRFSAFFDSTLTWDESLYLLVADSWLQGNPPYTTVWDNKPPGIYILFSGALLIFGRSVFAIRILACLFVATSCFLLYRLGKLIPIRGELVGGLAGVLYALTSLTNGGIASNTEAFFITFVVAGFYLAFSRLSSEREPDASDRLYFLLIGLMLGIGFEIKYVVLFDLLALITLLGLFILIRPSWSRFFSIAKTGGLTCFSFCLPFVLCSVYFWAAGHFDDYIYANFTANKLRTVETGFSFAVPLQAVLAQLRNNPLLGLSLPATLVYLSKAKLPSKERKLVSSFVIWIAIDLLLICTILRGHLYEHYFLQLFPALCLLAAYLITKLLFLESSKVAARGKTIRQAVFALLIVFFIYTYAFEHLLLGAKYVYFRYVKGIPNWEDTPALVADYLESKISRDDYIYVADSEPIIYFLTRAKIPTRYAFPPFLLLRVDLPNITGVEPLAELDRIMRKKPLYVIKRQSEADPYYVPDNRLFFKALDETLSQHYQLETAIEEVNLYRRFN